MDVAKTRLSPHLAAIMERSPLPAPMSTAVTTAWPDARFESTARLMAASYAALRWSSRTYAAVHGIDWIDMPVPRRQPSAPWPVTQRVLAESAGAYTPIVQDGFRNMIRQVLQATGCIAGQVLIVMQILFLKQRHRTMSKCQRGRNEWRGRRWGGSDAKCS